MPILLGKILTDPTPLKDYNIQESGFVVVMVARTKMPKPPAEV